MAYVVRHNKRFCTHIPECKDRLMHIKKLERALAETPPWYELDAGQLTRGDYRWVIEKEYEALERERAEAVAA